MKEYKSIVETLEAHGVPSTQGAIMAVKECIDAEVERRIKERMPSDKEIETQAIIKMQRDTKDGRIGILIDGTYADVFIDASEWLRSCLTNPGVNDSQKTEGGGE